MLSPSVSCGVTVRWGETGKSWGLCQSPPEEDSAECPPPSLTFTPQLSTPRLPSHSDTKHPGLSPHELWGKPETSEWNEGSICLRKLDTNKPGVNRQGQNYFSRLVTGFPPHKCPSLSPCQPLFLWVAVPPPLPSAPGPLGVGLVTNRPEEQGPKRRSQAAMFTRDHSHLPPGWGFSFCKPLAKLLSAPPFPASYQLRGDP